MSKHKAAMAAFSSLLSATDAQVLFDRTKVRKKVQQHNRTLCIKCRQRIPPGKPGRICKECRDA